MKTINKLFLIPVLASIGMTSAMADEFLNSSRHFLDDTHYWDDQMFGGLRVNYSLDAVDKKGFDQLQQGIESGDSLQNSRYFLDDTNYWDDQMFGRESRRVNYSISPNNTSGIDHVVYDDVFIQH